VPIGQEHVLQARDALFPTPLTAYPPPDDSFLATLSDRIAIDPFNAVASGIFLLAILHTFAAARFARWSHRIQHRYDESLKARGLPPRPSVAAEFLHFFGEVEVVFGLWVIPLIIAATAMRGWETVKHYVNETVVYQEPLFVVVIMALASTRPIITFAESALRKLADLGGGTPGAWWLAILIIGPLLGSFITEPAAMTISALLLARQFYDLDPSPRLKYATLGLLFVNVSIGGTLTHFAAPPVLMVARVWEWDTPFMLGHFGWRSAVAIIASTLLYYVFFRGELVTLARKHPVPDVDEPDTGANEVAPASPLPVPLWLVAIHVAFMVWTVVNAHYTALFIGSFLIFLGFARATAAYQGRVDLRGPLLVGFFLAGLVIHGGLQAWWIAPVLASLSEEPLFLGATMLTAFNDNALITYLATLVPDFSEPMKIAVVEGAVTGGGLTIIANAPNPAGQAILGRFFGGAVLPIYLFAGALVPTLLAIVVFRMI
jgi:hypothetical protein